MSDIKPSYYHTNGIDVIEYIKIAHGLQAAKEFCRGNVIKYITHFDKKNGVEDLRKAQTYINRLIELEGASSRTVSNFIPAEKGVRVVNGKTLYKCSYECECGDKGVRYVKETDNKTTCHKCGEELHVVKQSEVDDEFNYFKARFY